MKRIFADLHLRPNVKDLMITTRLASKAATLGYELVATSLPMETRPDEIQTLKTACKDLGLDFASRVDLRPRSPAELLSLLRKVRRRFEVVCVLCESKEVSRQAGKDRRVDLLNFPLLDFRRRFFDRAEAELASCGVASFEVDVKPLLVLEGAARVRLLAWLRREVAVALEFRLPVVVSSGISEPLLMRGPREMALLSSLFGVSGDAGLAAVSSTPVGIVEGNRVKLGAGFVAPGIRVLRQGGDC